MYFKTPITNLINYSIQEGSFPNYFITAYVIKPKSQKTKFEKKLPEKLQTCVRCQFYVENNWESCG